MSLTAASINEATLLPLVVDLDGTLTLSDTLHESCLALLKSVPQTGLSACLRLLPHLRAGKAQFKRAVAEAVVLDHERLPLNADLLDWLRQEHRAGRPLYLVTAADQSIADAVAGHLGLFDGAFGSGEGVNLSGARKLALIRSRIGERFLYAGDAPVDAPLFAAAEGAILVGNVKRLEALIPPDKPVVRRFSVPVPGLLTWMRAFRLPHWSKNLLVFIAPLLTIHHAPQGVLAQAFLLFLAMGFLASATYVVNDLLDLPADRRHPRKRLRPFASGAIPPRQGVVAAGALILLSFSLALALPASARLALLGYAAVTLAYSFFLKQQAIVDVFVLAGLFTLRILAGALLLPAAPSPWLLTFSMFFFLGLAMVKRHAELDRVVREGGSGVASRGYTARDLPLLLAAGVASSFAAIVMFMIYLIGEQYPNGMYRHPGLLWIMMPVLLIFVLRVWHLTIHGRMNEDPVMFALKDKTSLALGALALGALVLAL
ncbi:UbiA family prenyltransferase [Aquabacter sp. L1I39]|uniref:UbiA family prenyltransferase n=1 Tax=Aquabacter sp. L1I39 TaxID=2820278 RepID=UPI001ADBF6F5|nr:UbiA family prenyltransferase [Aquabacter sp. L1I39]QTL05355.1 UbiA family prenyltransferase [Aquabacter sp. L1I39]